MTKLGVRAWLRVVTGVTDIQDERDLKEGQDLAELLYQRLVEWAETDYDIDATTAGFDIGNVAAFAGQSLLWTTRSLLAQAAQHALRDADLDPVASVRVLELVSRYYDDDRLEMPDAP